MPRILFLTQVLPYPLDAGPKVRAYYMLRHLTEQHEVTLASFVRSDDAAQGIEHLRQFCNDVHTVPIRRSVLRNARAAVKGLLTGSPMVVARDEMQEMGALLRRTVGETSFDAIHADQLSMAGYGQMAARAASSVGGRPKTLLDEHNAIYVLAGRMATTESRLCVRAFMVREARAFSQYEREMCRRYDALLTVTVEDREHLLALFEPEERSRMQHKLTVVPICVDPDGAPIVERTGQGPPTILHLGTMFWPPNIAGALWFARDVLPLVREKVPEARFIVIGKNPPPSIVRLAADPRTEVTGYVADPSVYLSQSDVFIVPLHAAGGMRVKILNAWLWGLPVVSTPMGVEGIEYIDGENVLIAEDAGAFAAAVARLLCDRGLGDRLRANGRSWVEARYSWRQVYGQVDRVYESILPSWSSKQPMV